MRALANTVKQLTRVTVPILPVPQRILSWFGFDAVLE